jgi:hypothetical protein
MVLSLTCLERTRRHEAAMGAIAISAFLLYVARTNRKHAGAASIACESNEGNE